MFSSKTQRKPNEGMESPNRKVKPLVKVRTTL